MWMQCIGTNKNKINNNKKKKQSKLVATELIGLKKQMIRQYEDGNFVDAMDTMAQIAELKTMDPEIMLLGAKCYYETGDYERAITWINSTLEYSPGNIGARILLSKICLMDNNPEKGLIILNMIVEKMQSALSEKDKSIITELLDNCKSKMPDLLKGYPVLFNYLTGNQTKNKVSENDQKVSGKVENATPTKAEVAVNRLKALLNRNKICGKKEPITNQDNCKRQKGDSNSPEEIINNVVNQGISLRDKVKILNTYAGNMFINKQYHDSLQLLNEALKIDAQDEYVLRNLIYVHIAMNNLEKAMQYAALLPMTDFSVLDAINSHQ